jgi:hypothetical protein
MGKTNRFCRRETEKRQRFHRIAFPQKGVWRRKILPLFPKSKHHNYSKRRSLSPQRQMGKTIEKFSHKADSVTLQKRKKRGNNG